MNAAFWEVFVSRLAGPDAVFEMDICFLLLAKREHNFFPVDSNAFFFSLLVITLIKTMSTPNKYLIFPIVGLSLLLVISIVVGATQTKTGDANCQCIKKPDAGWRAFSITWFVGSIILIALTIVALAKSNFLARTVGFSGARFSKTFGRQGPAVGVD